MPSSETVSDESGPVHLDPEELTPMNLNELQLRVAGLEGAVETGRVSDKLIVRELDRLAEHLIGEPTADSVRYKQRIQGLILRVAPNRDQDNAFYIEAYCLPASAW